MHAYLVYDADCRLCTFVKDVAVALDWRRRIRPVALQDPSSSDLLAAVHESERDTSFHFVKGDEATSCGAGLLEVLGVLPMGAGIPKLAADNWRLDRSLLDYLGRVVDRNSSLMGYLRAFVFDPAVNFDRAIPLLAELSQLQQQDPAYFQSLRDEIIEAVRQYHRDMTASQGAEAGQPEAAQAGPADQVSSDSGAREAPEERRVDDAEKSED